MSLIWGDPQSWADHSGLSLCENPGYAVIGLEEVNFPELATFVGGGGRDSVGHD